MMRIIIGGSPRSGTTLLQLALCQDPSTNPYINEAVLLTHTTGFYVRAKAMLAAGNGKITDYFRDADELQAYFSASIEPVFDKLAERYEAKHIVLKDPFLTPLFPHFWELVPDARFICMVRDPKDAIASMIRVGEKLHQQGVKHQYQERDCKALSNYYKSFCAPIINSKNETFSAQVMIVRYEDLVIRTQNVYNQLTEFTTLTLPEYSPDRIFDSGEVDFSRMDGEAQAWVTVRYKDKISAASIGRYAEVLNDEEIATIERECRDVYDMFYADQPVTAR